MYFGGPTQPMYFGARPVGQQQYHQQPQAMASAEELECMRKVDEIVAIYNSHTLAVQNRLHNVNQTLAMENRLHNQRQQHLNNWNRQLDQQLCNTWSNINAHPTGGRSASQATYDRCHDNVNMMDPNCVYSYTYTSDI